MQPKRTSIEVIFHNPNEEREMIRFLLSRIADGIINGSKETTDFRGEGEEIENRGILSGIDGQD